MSESNKPCTSRHQRRASRIWSASLAVALLGGLAACSSDDSEGSAEPSSAEVGTETTASGEGSDDAGSDGTGSDNSGEDAGSSAGSSSGTVSMADGTDYTFTMSTCETSDTESYIEEGDFYDINGTTDDGAFAISLGRAPYGDGTAIETALFEGDFDDEGKNAGINYSDVADTMALTVDGGDVSGTVTLSPIGPNKPHGDEVVATVDISC